MKKISKRMISIIIACMMVITLVPFTGSKVNASEVYQVGKISLKLAPGSLLQPGFDEDIPGSFDVSFDTSDSSADVNAMTSGKIIIDSAYWGQREIESWPMYMGPAEEGRYRMIIDLTNNALSTSDQVNYVFGKTITKVYVDGVEWSIIHWGPDGEEIIALGPEYTVEESTTPVYKPNSQPTQQPTQQPTAQPTQQPTAQPTQQPTAQPTQQPTAQPTTQPTAQPTTQPTSQPTQPSDVSTKITGAPKNLVCSISKGNARQIDVEFDPDLECGIDKNCGVVIAASTDNKATWQKVEGWDFVSGNKDLKWNTYALSGSTYFKIDYEKTYYVKAYYVDSEGKKGPDSNICGPFGPVEDESKIPGKVEEASKTAVKTTGNDAGVLKKGTSVTFERAFYKLTVTVKDIKGSDIIFTVNLENNKPYDTYLFMEHGSIRYTDKKGKPHDMMDIFGETTIDISDMAMGCTKITIPVTAELRQKYDRNQKKYKFEETFYFDAAPLAPSLGLTKADKKSITLGKAYSATTNCTDSGTTVYYKKKGASKWKEKSFAKGKTIKLTGLSAGSSYQVKAVDYVKSKDRYEKVKTIKGTESKVSIFRTAYKSAPKIKSVKTSKVKQKTKKFNGQWVPSGKSYKWQKPYSLKVTTYKLTIKMKSKPTNAAGMIIKDPDGVVHVIKGAKSKYTLSGEIKGFKKGQKVKFKVATFGNGDRYDSNSGVSPYKTITVTMK